MTRNVSINEAQNQLPTLLVQAQQGDEVIITDGNKPLARLVPISEPKKQRIAGLNKGEIWTSEDFDEPLPDEFWTGQE